jgi:hypothetical protein
VQKTGTVLGKLLRAFLDEHHISAVLNGKEIVGLSVRKPWWFFGRAVHTCQACSLPMHYRHVLYKRVKNGELVGIKHTLSLYTSIPFNEDHYPTRTPELGICPQGHAWVRIRCETPGGKKETLTLPINPRPDEQTAPVKRSTSRFKHLFMGQQ